MYHIGYMVPRTLRGAGAKYSTRSKLMYYVYVLKSMKDSKLYLGRTDDLRRRKHEHDNGKVSATKYRRPLKLVFYEAYVSKEDAVRRERYFKTTKGKSSLKMMLRKSLKAN